jgi:hypothetical protein
MSTKSSTSVVTIHGPAGYVYTDVKTSAAHSSADDANVANAPPFSRGGDAGGGGSAIERIIKYLRILYR